LPSSDTVADAITEALTFVHFPSASDANVIYYVSGYIARSIIRSTRCDYCKDCLITDDRLELVELDSSLDYSAATFLDSINRGGLGRPTDFTFLVAIRCWRVFEEIKRRLELLQQMLLDGCQRVLLCKIIERASCVQAFGHRPIDTNICVAGHHVNLLIAQIFFSCVAKNLVKDMTNKANAHVESSSKRKRKCAKLTGGDGQCC